MKKKKQSDRKKHKINHLRLGLTVMVIGLMVVLGMSVKNVISLHMEQNKLQEHNKNLVEEKSSLETELKNVNDRSYIEEQARIQLRLIKPGEILYILDDEKGKGQKADTEDKGKEKSEESNGNQQ